DGSNRHLETSSRIAERNMKSMHFPLVLVTALAITFSLAVCAQAQTYTDLANFDGQNGGAPGGPVTQATDGNFYGVTGEGGAAEGGSGGNVFRVTPTGTITSTYRSCSLPNCAA